MIYIRGLGLIAFCCLLFTLGGGLVAALLNWLVPAYYPGVFPHYPFDAGNKGISTGHSQGLILGFVVGTTLAFGLGWFGQLSFMSVVRTLLFVALCGLVFAVLGLAVGWCLGTYAPGYYGASFRVNSMNPPDLNPVAVRMGLGCSEGLTIGLLVGAILAVGLARWQSRRVSGKLAAFDQHPYDRSSSPDAPHSSSAI